MGDADWKTKIDAAHRMVSALCQPRGSAGTREWIMSIPARPDYDPDLVISAGLRAAEAEVKRLRKQVKLLTFQLDTLRRHPEFHNLDVLAQKGGGDVD